MFSYNILIYVDCRMRRLASMKDASRRSYSVTCDYPLVPMLIAANQYEGVGGEPGGVGACGACGGCGGCGGGMYAQFYILHRTKNLSFTRSHSYTKLTK